MLLSVGGQRGEWLAERDSSLCAPILLDEVYIRTNQGCSVGGAVVVDMQFEFYPTTSQQREIGDGVGEVVGCYFQQPAPRASR